MKYIAILLRPLGRAIRFKYAYFVSPSPPSLRPSQDTAAIREQQLKDVMKNMKDRIKERPK